MKQRERKNIQHVVSLAGNINMWVVWGWRTILLEKIVDSVWLIINMVPSNLY